MGVFNEVLNAGLKSLLRRVAGPESEMLRRPEVAVDSGIYPQHYPRPSTTSGMPSGHSQTAAMVAVIFTCAVLQTPSAMDEGVSDLSQDSPGWRSYVGKLPLLYIWLIALAVMVSRTRFGGPLSVKVDGRTVAHHTVLQVFVGAGMGTFLGLAAVRWHAGSSYLLWLGLAIVLAVVVAIAGVISAGGASSEKSSEESGSEGSTEECLSSDMPCTEDSTSGSEQESRQRWLDGSTS